MNPTTDHFLVPERAITRNNAKKIKYQIKKMMEWLTLESNYLPWVIELPIKTIHECLIFFNS